MEVYLLYECDSWHSRSSMELLGVFSTYPKMIDALRDIADTAIKEGHLNADDVEDIVKEFDNNRQTQGYATNYLYEVATLDEY